ncbi:MAG TPA: pyridoxal-phosphate dependent enzyme, partial [Saprospiraceae bacterium]|nr:pyridoxal-phosphate dependent enzyme [Saprospiraceae bacterium]
MQSELDWKQFVPGPIQAIPGFLNHQTLHLLRLDQLQSWSSGNKYYKLKYPLHYAIEHDIHTIVSKGGMFSNHLAALAEATYHFHIQLVAIIRSHVPDEGNPTMSRLKELNCRLLFVTPEEYDKYDEQASQDQFPGAMFIDEGGLSVEGIRGSAEIVEEFRDLNFDHVVIAGGSMCTALGIIKALPEETQLHIVPAWKGCNNEYVQELLVEYDIHPSCQWDTWPEYHFGGFGKFNQELIDFMKSFTIQTKVVLDPVYTGKLLYALADK